MRPQSFGKKFWAQRGHFRFADKVAERYMLAQICEEAFLDVADAPPMPTADRVLRSDQGRLGTPAALRVSRNDPGYVYVIKSPYGYKIGKSRRLRDRVKLFGVKLPFQIDLLMSGWCEDYTAEEAQLHQLFHAKRLEGEWFNLDEADLALLRGRLSRAEPEQPTQLSS